MVAFTHGLEAADGSVLTTATTNEEGNTETFRYDSLGNLAAVTDGHGRETAYTYNALGLVESIVHRDGTTTGYEYDHLGNMTRVTDSLGTAAAYTYDKAGRLIVERSRPGVDRSYTYDELDRITAIYSGGQLVERHSYTERGRTVTVTDGKGENYVYRKDEFGRLVEEQNRLGGRQVYTYDGEGRLQTKRDFNGGTTTIEYTAGGTTKTIRYADGTAETLRYDMAGQLVRATGSSGTLGYEYDRGGRLVRQHDEATGETVTYAYDKAGRRILMAGVGRETAYRYGRNGELLEVRDNRQRLSVSYKYDVMGRETERIFGNGVSQHTAYDKAGRVILITEKSGNNILLRGEGYVYDSLGRRSATVSHTGAVTRYEYNPAGQLAKVQYPESQELRDLQEKEARQHGLHWQEGVSGLSNGHLSTGEYTELSRLFVRMRNGGGFLPTTQVFRTEMYTYDANGNRATKTTAYGTITYSYDAENRLVKTCGNTGVGVEYAYDNNGNLLSQTSSFTNAVYEYNPQNRMVRSRVVDDEARTIASTRYGYDPLGRRALVQDNNVATLRTLYDGLGFDVVKESPVYASGGFTDTYNIGIQYEPAGRATGERYRYLDDGQGTGGKYQYIEDNAYQTVSSRYTGERTMLYAHGSPVAINRSSGTRGYLGTDILGSTRSVTDNHGTQESYYDYDIFGSPITGNYTTGADYGYLGKPYDSITGLYNYGYRDYSPHTVRFTTVDPIRDGSNWFAYVNNDPVNYIDLWGLLASDGGRTVPNTWRDNKDGTYTALPGATLYELYGENWREESGYVGNPSNLQVGDVVGRKSSFMENSVSQPIVNSKQEVLVIDNSFPQVTNSEEIFEGYSHRTNIAIGVTEIVLGVGIIVSSTITTGTINVVSGGMTTIPAGWAIIEGWAAGSTFIALGITRLSNANNSRVSDDIKQVFIPSVVDVAEGIDDVSKGQEQ